MPREQVGYRSAAGIVESVRAGEVTATTVVERVLETIDARNDRTNAFVTVCAEEARQAAREADRAHEAGQLSGPLHGVPVALKDLEGLKAGVRHTFGSVPFASWVPDVTVPFVQRLEAAGAIVVGKTNTPEFGHLGSTDNRLFGPTSTPFDLDRNAGGSSGGSAAAVADGLVPIAQGSDMGGSIRVPAAFCGVVGVKPSFGRVPSSTRPDGYGHAAPTTQIGPIARTVEDAALMLDILAGPHPADPFSMPDEGPGYVDAVDHPVEGLKIAYSPTLGGFPIQPRVASRVDAAVDALDAAGAEVERIDEALPRGREALFEVLETEVATYHATMVEAMGGPDEDLLADHGDDLMWSFRETIERGRRIDAVDLRLGDVARTELLDHLSGLFERVDVLVTPTAGIVPFENETGDGVTLGPSRVQGEAVNPSIGWALTYPFNLTGHPAASVPAGLTDGGLPAGLQIIGPRLADARVLAVAGALERARPWHGSYPWA